MPRQVLIAGRLLGAAAAGATAGIHLHLWLDGYSGIPTIGPLFLANAVGGALLSLALLATPRRLLPVTALGLAGYEGSTLIALALSTDLPAGLFGFRESSLAPLYWQSVGVECFGIVMALALLAATLRPSRNALSVGPVAAQPR